LLPPPVDAPLSVEPLDESLLDDASSSPPPSGDPLSPPLPVEPELPPTAPLPDASVVDAPELPPESPLSEPAAPPDPFAVLPAAPPVGGVPEDAPSEHAAKLPTTMSVERPIEMLFLGATA
jgi:hypothetical protein